MEYYGGEYERLMALYENEKEASFKEPLGMAFVTFSSYNMSKEVHDAFKKSWYSCCNGAPDACLSTILQTSKWTVSYAPEPEDIYWENLGSSSFFLLKLILVNVALFIFTLFLTTPGKTAAMVRLCLGSNIHSPNSHALFYLGSRCQGS